MIFMCKFPLKKKNTGKEPAHGYLHMCLDCKCFQCVFAHFIFFFLVTAATLRPPGLLLRSASKLTDIKNDWFLFYLPWVMEV